MAALLLPAVAALPASAAEPEPGTSIVGTVPPLEQTFTSSEGVSFRYPAGWVVAFDRSGGSGAGAVCVVGLFTGEPITIAGG